MTTFITHLRHYALFILLFTFQTSYSQNTTFADIYDVFQVKCTGCHGGASPQGGMDLSGSQAEVYNTLVGFTPINPLAASKGYERVKAGYPERSFLLHKLATENWDDTYSLEVAEGDAMPPNNLPPLAEKEIELVRQWILYGAPMDGTVVDPQILEDYYENGLALGTTAPIAPPAEGEGFQLKLGPIFLAPLEEREFFKKHELTDNGAFEINSLDVSFNDESHHFILYSMNPALGATYAEGLRNEEDTEDAIIDNTLIAAWQNVNPYVLPAGTAYRVAANTQFDLNYHMKNYSATAVLAGNVYINIYTQPMGTADKEMFSELFPVSLFDQFIGAPLGSGLEIPNDGEEYTFTEHLWIPGFPGIPWEGGTWNIWRLSTHTHARGVDYDIYLATDAQGTKGEQIFEGFSNSDHTFNQGYYDWEHPPVRVFDPLMPVNMDIGAGIVHEAKYVNNEAETLNWGSSVDDEMMLIFIHYTVGEETSATNDLDGEERFQLNLFPNPVTKTLQLEYKLKEAAKVDVAIYDLLGNKIGHDHLGMKSEGTQQYQFDVDAQNLASGIYLLKMSVGGELVVRKFVVSQ